VAVRPERAVPGRDWCGGSGRAVRSDARGAAFSAWRGGCSDCASDARHRRTPSAGPDGKPVRGPAPLPESRVPGVPGPRHCRSGAGRAVAEWRGPGRRQRRPVGLLSWADRPARLTTGCR
jgi:hypothetical protein